MSTIKARTQGNSIMIFISSAFGVEEGEEFFLVQKDNGAITLISKEEDHFANVREEEYYVPEEDFGCIRRGRT